MAGAPRRLDDVVIALLQCHRHTCWSVARRSNLDATVLPASRDRLAGCTRENLTLALGDIRTSGDLVVHSEVVSRLIAQEAKHTGHVAPGRDPHSWQWSTIHE